MSRLAIAIVLSLIAGFALGAWVDVKAPSSPESDFLIAVPDENASAEERLRWIEQVVDEEREARLVIEEQLLALMREIEELEPLKQLARESERARAEAAAMMSETTATDGPAVNRRSRNLADRMRRFQDARIGRFREYGYTEDEIQRVLALEAEMQLRAMTEQWEAQKNGDAYNFWNADPHSALRDELGDAGFERYLKAQGQQTSVQINAVIQGSAGQIAGLEPGDRIVSYNGDRIFSVRDIRNLSMQGNRGDDVVIEVERDGVRMQLAIPRGPIGINGNGANMRGLSMFGG